MDKKTGRAVFIIALAAAVVCIAAGVFNVWKSFARFDDNILNEKDTQFYSLMRSGDINIENSINAIEREAETFLSRERLKSEIESWKEDGNTDSLESYIAGNTLTPNPIYADLVMYDKDKVLCTASGNADYTSVTGIDSNSMHLCTDGNGVYYLAYNHEAADGISYDVLIDLTKLYSSAIGVSPECETMLVDYTSTLMITSDAEAVIVKPVSEKTDEKTANFRDYLVRCQQEDIADGMSIELTDERRIRHGHTRKLRGDDRSFQGGSRGDTALWRPRHARRSGTPSAAHLHEA